MAIREALQWRVRRLFKYRVPRIYYDAGGDHRDSILILGGGRTGTTWVTDVVDWRHEYRNMYEPFNGFHVPLCKAFRPHQYLRPDNDDPRYLEPARRIFAGRIRNGWIDQYNRAFFARKRLLKDVWTALCGRWIYEHFPGMPIVVTMRHPCATALSRAQMQWPGRFTDLLEQPDLIADYLNPYLDELRDRPDPFVRHLILWCIEYGVMLSRFRPGEIHLVFYERLCTNPEEDLPDLCRFAGVEYDRRMLGALSIPSVQATRSRRLTPSAIVAGNNLVSSWRARVTQEQHDEARRLLRRFGLDAIYGDADMPDVDAALALMRS